MRSSWLASATNRRCMAMVSAIGRTVRRASQAATRPASRTPATPAVNRAVRIRPRCSSASWRSRHRLGDPAADGSGAHRVVVPRAHDVDLPRLAVRPWWRRSAPRRAVPPACLARRSAPAGHHDDLYSGRGLAGGVDVGRRVTQQLVRRGVRSPLVTTKISAPTTSRQPTTSSPACRPSRSDVRRRSAASPTALTGCPSRYPSPRTVSTTPRCELAAQVVHVGVHHTLVLGCLEDAVDQLAPGEHAARACGPAPIAAWPPARTGPPRHWTRSAPTSWRGPALRRARAARRRDPADAAAGPGAWPAARRCRTACRGSPRHPRPARRPGHGLAQRGEHQGGDVATPRPEPGEQVETFDRRQSTVEEDQVVVAGQAEMERSLAVTGQLDGVPLAGEQVGQHRGQLGVVLDHEQPRGSIHHASIGSEIAVSLARGVRARRLAPASDHAAFAPLWPISTTCTEAPRAATTASTEITTDTHAGEPAFSAASRRLWRHCQTEEGRRHGDQGDHPRQQTVGQLPHASRSADCDPPGAPATRRSRSRAGRGSVRPLARRRGRGPAQRRNRGHTAARNTLMAAAGTITTVACTRRGWSGSPASESGTGFFLSKVGAQTAEEFLESPLEPPTPVRASFAGRARTRRPR